MPHEFVVLGICFSPYVPVVGMGVLAALLSALLLNRLGLSRYFVSPPWVFVAMAVMYSCLTSRLWIAV